MIAKLVQNFRTRWDIRAKVSVILVAVIVPTFMIVTIAQNKFTFPLLEEEIRQIGINSGRTLAARINSERFLLLSNPIPSLESAIQDVLYSQPDILRIDVLTRDPKTGQVRILASSAEDEPGTPPPSSAIYDSVYTEFLKEDSGDRAWQVFVPIEHRSRDPRGPRRLTGMVHLVISTNLVARIVTTIWKTTGTAAAFSVVTLILVLGYFLRKTIDNDRLLRKVEVQNLKLTEQLHDAERKLMNREKLAVMGQLTATFAHEIGTPLNAIGGHLQLLKEELPSGSEGRLEIINGQLSKIEGIVKSFLQSTAKPNSQKQLVDLNLLVDKTLGIVIPRVESLGIDVKRQMDRSLGPLRLVPLEIEQILLNLLNNSLDSLESKLESRARPKALIEVKTELVQIKGGFWAQVAVYDTGEGIKKTNLENVLKPFFTTKRPGEGTGLGLPICQQIAKKYGGDLIIDSKEGVWTQVALRIPYQTEKT